MEAAPSVDHALEVLLHGDDKGHVIILAVQDRSSVSSVAHADAQLIGQILLPVGCGGSRSKVREFKSLARVYILFWLVVWKFNTHFFFVSCLYFVFVYILFIISKHRVAFLSLAIAL